MGFCCRLVDLKSLTKGDAGSTARKYAERSELCKII